MHLTMQRGFSMLELVVVMLILMVVVVISAPVMNGIVNVKLRSSAGNVASLLQQARVQAVQRNAYITFRAGAIGNAPIGYLDTIGDTATDGSGNSSYDNGEKVVQLPTTTAFATSGAPASLATSAYGLANAIASSSISFNSRGLPCKVVSGVCNTLDAGIPVSYVVYFRGQRPQTWAAVSVSSAGRVKSWFYSGSTWQ